LRACVVDQEALLNDRQTQVLVLASKGLTGKEIGKELGVTFGAVRNQFYRIYRKLEVKNRAEAISKAIELGLINPSWGYRPLRIGSIPLDIIQKRICESWLELF
jgi:DNA-binding CsgD family transcriptional regulator